MDVLVTPSINPDLSDYFIQLNGITQERLNGDGIGFADALNARRAFLYPKGIMNPGKVL